MAETASVPAPKLLQVQLELLREQPGQMFLFPDSHGRKSTRRGLASIAEPLNRVLPNTAIATDFIIDSDEAQAWLHERRRLAQGQRTQARFPDRRQRPNGV